LFDKIIGALRQALTDAIPEGSYACKQYDALDKDFAPEPEKNGPSFANISHETASDQQMSMGGRPRFSMDGFAHVQLFDSLTGGDVAQLRAASRIADALRFKRVTGTGFTIRFEAPALVNLPRLGSYWSRDVRTPFRVSYYPTVN
jgi:hypothetical protein